MKFRLKLGICIFMLILFTSIVNADLRDLEKRVQNIAEETAKELIQKGLNNDAKSLLNEVYEDKQTAEDKYNEIRSKVESGEEGITKQRKDSALQEAQARVNAGDIAGARAILASAGFTQAEINQNIAKWKTDKITKESTVGAKNDKDKEKRKNKALVNEADKLLKSKDPNDKEVAKKLYKNAGKSDKDFEKKVGKAVKAKEKKKEKKKGIFGLPLWAVIVIPVILALGGGGIFAARRAGVSVNWDRIFRGRRHRGPPPEGGETPGGETVEDLSAETEAQKGAAGEGVVGEGKGKQEPEGGEAEARAGGGRLSNEEIERLKEELKNTGHPTNFFWIIFTKLHNRTLLETTEYSKLLQSLSAYNFPERNIIYMISGIFDFLIGESNGHIRALESDYLHKLGHNGVEDLITWLHEYFPIHERKANELIQLIKDSGLNKEYLDKLYTSIDDRSIDSIAFRELDDFSKKWGINFNTLKSLINLIKKLLDNELDEYYRETLQFDVSAIDNGGVRELVELLRRNT